MFDGLLGRGGFSSKCKSLIKLTRTRIEVIRRKRDATQKFLKKDIADLLANGLESNALGRAEGLIAELCLTSCYDFIDDVCVIILKYLSTMQKNRDCPEECRESVASLIFSAARFSDLPELRDLRDMFKDRFGDSLECYVNQNLVKHIAPKPPDMDKKLKLLEDIASEFSIAWDRSAFEQSNKAVVREKTHAYLHPAENKSMRGPHASKTVHQQMSNNGITAKKKIEVSDRVKGREGLDNEQELGYTRHNSQVAPVTVQKSKDANAFPRRREFIIDGPSSSAKENGNLVGTDTSVASPLLATGGLKAVPRTEQHIAAYQAKAEPVLAKGEPHVKSIGHIKQRSQDSIATPMRHLPEEEADRLKSTMRSNIPPPYVKPKKSKHRSRHSESNINGDNNDTLTFGSQNLAPEKDDIPHFTVEYYKNNTSGNDPTPRRRSRRRHHKPSSTPSDNDNAEEIRVVRRTPTSRRRNESKKGLQILCDDDHHGRSKDEEERVMDKLLLHYSKKPVDGGGSRDKTRRKTKTESSANKVEVKHQVQQPSRSASLPPEHSSTEMKKVFTRAASLDEDASTPAKHVHPKLPDCDDLAARFAALRRK